MSRYTIVELQIKDVICLRDALKTMNYPFEEYQEAKPLVGFQSDERSEKAHIIIRRKNLTKASNDIGFLRDETGQYKMIISDYDRQVKKIKEDFMQRLTKEYSTAKIRKKCLQLGASITQQVNMEDGRIKIKAVIG